MNKNLVPYPKRASYSKHRRELTRQIVLPIALASLVGLAFAILAGVGASTSQPGVSLWADISIIWLIIPMMLLTLVIMALALGLVYGLNRLIKVSPHYTGLAQTYALWLSAEVKIWVDKTTRPVLTIKAWLDLIFKTRNTHGTKK